jgi:outer membrane autotransporter protein
LGRLTLGAFVEYGSGSYDTYNSFTNAGAVHGDGDIRHIGGGLLGRFDFAGSESGHFYAEASGRAGRIENEYANSDLRDPATGIAASYESSSAYFGFHLGVGRVFNLSDSASLDLYAKYFFTRQKGDEVTLTGGDRVSFKDVDSSRLRVGTRFNYDVNRNLGIYAGVAYEREFNGVAKATTNGRAITAPSIKGGTFIGELGLSLRPSASVPFTIELGAQGYAGKRRGVTGSLSLKFEF